MGAYVRDFSCSTLNTTDTMLPHHLYITYLFFMQQFMLVKLKELKLH